MREEEFEIDGKMVKIGIKKLSYKAYNEILQKCSKISVSGANTNTDINFFKLRYMVTEASVVLPAGYKLDDLPVEVGNKLESIALEAIGMGDKPSFPEQI
jgi:hypothetical protein